MRLRKTLGIGGLCLSVLLIAASARSQNIDNSDSSGSTGHYHKYAVWAFRYNWCTSHYQDVGSNVTHGRDFGGGRWRIDQKMAGVSWVVNYGGAEFSMQGPINTILMIASNYLSGADKDMFSYYSTPEFTVLTFPSSEISYACTESFLLGLDNNTEYILARGNDGKRGIYYTPSIAATIRGYSYNSEVWDMVSLQARLGVTLFWNFEGVSRVEGVTFGLEFNFGYAL